MKRQHKSTTSSKTEQMASQAKSRKQVENSIVQTVRVKCSRASKVFKDLYLNERTADVFFNFIIFNERVPAHKAILSFGSSKYKNLLFGPSAVSGDILVTGRSPEEFKDFLQFFYLDEVSLKTTTIREVFRSIKMYDLPSEYSELCGRFCVNNYDYRNINNICFVYCLAKIFENDKSQTICERQIATHCEKIFKTHDFLSCPFDVIGRILDLDTLLCDESVVMSACLAWARNTCKQNGKDEFVVANWRECLIDNSNGTNLLHKIRYGSISHEKFSIYLDSLHKLFPDASEREDVMFLLLGSKNSKTGKFSTKPRKELEWNDEYAMDCMFEEKDIYSTLRIKKQFNHILTTTQAILLGGFYIVPLISKASDVAFICVNMKIFEQQIDGGAGRVVSKIIHKECQKVPERMGKLFMQFKPKPIVMRPDREYHIEIDLKLDGRNYYYINDNGDFYLEDRTNYDSDDGTFHGWIDEDGDDDTDYDSDETNVSDDNAHSISFYDEVEYNQRIKINKDLTIQCYSNNSRGPCGHLIIKGFKFIQL